jgi:hypothetical protein
MRDNPLNFIRQPYDNLKVLIKAVNEKLDNLRQLLVGCLEGCLGSKSPKIKAFKVFIDNIDNFSI